MVTLKDAAETLSEVVEPLTRLAERSPAGAGAPADTTVSAAPPGSGGLRPLLTQFLDSTADEQSGAELSAVLTTALWSPT